ncbi:cyclic nucleotide-binding domain-containing protein [Aminipila butyrica]|uniref:Cyclic nucleotide-binding domain-containing protein n=1 Tax=Aminipila butyrica TaxID=433296 RepID=A0A858BZW3_9FIRM|nr:cyclic nucleotide-binding domain-containing protein [Aminipila butyrica]QIB70490.1 cyclic nucleotide-binding domain-containing protein [Aminipila butyrica]
MSNSSLTVTMKSELQKYGLSDFETGDVRVLKFEKGQYLCREGFPMEYLLFMISGKAKTFINVSNGKSLLLAFYTKSGILGDIELMTDGVCTTNVQALTEVTCMGIPMSYGGERLRKNVTFMNFVGAHLARKLDRCARNGAINILLPLETRLCSYVLMTSEEGLFNENLTEVAELLGTSYRHLLRTFDGLRKDRVLEKVARGYIIRDGVELQIRAQDFYTM